MSFEVRTISVFERQAKRLKKKYASLKPELIGLVHSLSENPEQGIPIGNSCFKIRLAIKSKKRGKSGGARVITHVLVASNKVYLLSIYDKSEQMGIDQREIDRLISLI